MAMMIDPDTENSIRNQARARGMDPASYLRTLVEQADGRIVPPETSLEEFERDWEAFCQPVPGLTADVDLSREAIYHDHD
jgi:hypothetical protein